MKNTVLYIMCCLLCANAKGQGTAEEFGKKVFLAFKQDSLENLFQSRLKKNQVPGFLFSKGIDTGSSQTRQYLSRYDEVTAKFIDQCRKIKTDTVENKLSWASAKLSKVMVKENVNDTYKEPKNKIAEVKFVTKEREFTFLFEALYYNNAWLIGNSITCFVSYSGWDKTFIDLTDLPDK